MQKGKRIISWILTLAMLCSFLPMLPISVSAEESAVLASGDCGENVTWVLTEDGTLTISGEGAMYDYNHYGETGNQTPWYEYITEITSVVVNDGITHLGRAAFNTCQNMASVSLPASLESIGEMAFLNCLGISELVIPEGVTTIGDCAFYWSGVTRVVLPSTLKSTGVGAFWGTGNLQEVVLTEGLEVIDTGAFAGSNLPELTIPASVHTIGDTAFDQCLNLTDVTFIGDAPAFGENAFSGDALTAHYPADNETWTEDVMQQYGGTITWVPAPESEAKQEINLWTYPIGNWGDTETVEALIADFEAANPGINVTVTYLDYMTGDSEIDAAIEAGTLPDLILEGPERLVTNWGAQGLMADLSDLLDDSDLSEIYTSSLAACYGTNGSLYEYPLAGTVHVMAINKTVFEAAGAMQYLNEETRTWNSAADFFNAVQTVYDYTGMTVGTVYCGSLGGDQGTRALVNNLYGGTYTNADHTAYTWNSEENIAALQALYSCEGIEFNPGIAGGDEIAMFVEGELNMAFCWNITQQLNPNMADTGAGLTASGDEIMFVAFPSNGTPQLCGGVWGFGVFDNGDDARMEAAKTFVKFMCDSEETVDAVRASGYFAVRNTAEGTDLTGIWEDDAVMQEYSTMMPMLGDYYVTAPNWSNARNCWMQMLQQIATGEDIAETAAYWNNSANGIENEETTELNVLTAQYGEHTADWWAQFEQDFEAAHENIDLILECCDWNSLYTKVNSCLAEGNAPDILNIDSYEPYQGMLLAVQDYMSESTYAKFPASFLAESEIAGIVWAVPDLASARGLYYNVDILETVGASVPTTWAELEAVCAAIKAHYGDEVIPWGLDVSSDEGQAAFAMHTWANGGGFLGADGDWNLNSDENVEAIEYAVSLYNNGYTNGTDLNRYDLQDLFCQGQVAMIIAPDSFAFRLEDINYGVAMLPANEGKNAHSIGVMDRFMCFDNGYSEEELAAVTAFFDFLYEDSRYTQWMQTEGFLPATISGMEAIAEKDPSMAAWVEILDSCKFYPANKGEWATVRNGVKDVLAQALDGGDVRQLLDDLQAEITGGSGEEDPTAPFLSYRWLGNDSEGWFQQNNWMVDGNEWSNGYTGGIGMTPGDEFWMVFYLNTWNEETSSYDASPVYVDVTEQLAAELLCEGDHLIRPDAEDSGYYYCIHALEDAWDQVGIISYTMDDGNVVSLEVYLSRGEAGFYSSPEISNETYIRNYYYNRISSEPQVFYFGFDSEYWTLDYADFFLNYSEVPGKEAYHFFSTERISENVYQITLTEWAVSSGIGFDIGVNLYTTDPDLNSNEGNWFHGIWCNADWDAEYFDSNMNINGTQTAFTYIGEEVRAFQYVPSGEFDEWGNEVYLLQQAELPDGFSYDMDSNTITLNNCSLEFLHLNYRSQNDDGSFWQELPSGDLTIELIGDNSIYSTVTSALRLDGGVNLTITGDGSLSICAENSLQTDGDGNYIGFDAVELQQNSSLTIEGNAQVYVTIMGEALESCWDGDTCLGTRPRNLCAIRGNENSLTLRDNAYLATFIPDGAKESGPLLENEDDVIWDDWTPGGYRGLDWFGSITIEGGTLRTQTIQLSTHWEDDVPLYCGSYHQSGGTVTITAQGSIHRTEKWEWNEETQEDVYIGIVPHYHYGGLGNHEGGTIEITGGELYITASPTEEEIASSAYGNALYVGTNGHITIDGGNVYTNVSTGDTVTAGNLTVNSGTLIANSDNGSAVYVEDGFTVNGGTLELSSAYGDTVNLTHGDMIISGGSVTVTSTESNSICVGDWQTYDDPYTYDPFNGTLTVTGGTLTVHSGQKHNSGINIRRYGKAVFSGDATVELNNGHLIVDGSMLLDEAAQIHLNDSQFSVYENGTMTVDGGEFHCTVNKAYETDNEWPTGAYVDRYGTLIINGGTMEMDFQNCRVGLMSHGNVTMNGGTVSIAITNDKGGYYYVDSEDGSYVDLYNVIAYAGNGYTTINGGELNLQGLTGIEQSFDAGGPDWPENRETKLTINGGTVNINAQYAGMDISAPVEFNGGIVNIDVSGTPHPVSGIHTGDGLWVWGNGFSEEDVASSVTINGGIIRITCATGESASTGAISVSNAKLYLNGGNVTCDAGYALWAMGNNAEVQIADGIKLISLSSGEYKNLLTRVAEYSYTDEDGNAVTMQRNCITVEEDNKPGDPYTGEGLDGCTYLLISADSCGDDLTWNFRNGTLTISGTGDMDDYEIDTAPWYALRNKITSVIVAKHVTSVGSYAFSGCTNLKTILFQGNAPDFGSNAFLHVTATASYYKATSGWTTGVMKHYGGRITWDSIDTVATGWSGSTQWTLTDDGTLTVYGSGNMKNYGYNGGQPWLDKGVDITSVVIEEGVTSVGSGAFRNLTTLKSVTFPETTLTKMGEAAFYGSGLESVEIPASLWTIQPYTFKNCADLTEVIFHEGNLQKISDGAFYGTGLTELVLPDCLDILDIYAFKGCSKLTDITIGSGLTELREAVFYGTAISEITIPEGITKIGPYAFKNCVNLETVDMPESLTSVGEASFYACTALKTVDLPDAVTTIGNYAFRKCAAITSLKLSANLVTIGECAFYGCSGLTELLIPDKVTTIKPYAFKTCTGLTSVTLGSSVETIGEGAFNTCTGLKTIVFPASLKTIGDYCFSGSYNLWKLTFEGDAPSIGTGAFKGLAATAYYPAGNSTWTSANMLNYGGKITWKAQ